MLMELGLHNAEVFKHTLKSEAERTEACTLVSSIVILDRQWSYATGLPIHFHETSFSAISTSSVSTPDRYNDASAYSPRSKTRI
jgi:hypothetical protein